MNPNKQWVYKVQYWDVNNKVGTKYIHGYSIQDAIENNFYFRELSLNTRKLVIEDIAQEYFEK